MRSSTAVSLVSSAQRALRWSFERLPLDNGVWNNVWWSMVRRDAAGAVGSSWGLSSLRRDVVVVSTVTARQG